MLLLTVMDCTLMPQGIYKGKRTAVTMPHSIYSLIYRMAKEESRTASQQMLYLIKEGLKSKSIEIPPEMEDEDKTIVQTNPKQQESLSPKKDKKAS